MDSLVYFDLILYRLSCCKYMLSRTMYIKPQLKVVHNKCAISSSLSNVGRNRKWPAVDGNYLAFFKNENIELDLQ